MKVNPIRLGMLQKGADDLYKCLREGTMQLGNRPLDAMELMEILVANVIVKVIKPKSADDVLRVFAENVSQRMNAVKNEQRSAIIIPTGHGGFN